MIREAFQYFGRADHFPVPHANRQLFIASGKNDVVRIEGLHEPFCYAFC